MNACRSRRVLILAALFVFGVAPVKAQEKPNVMVIWGDDVGQSNISAYSFGLMGYRTPNIDRIASEGMMFTDYYGEQSSTAGRASYITGQSVFRTGLLKTGTTIGMQKEDPTIAGLLKEHGYLTGQFGKNHLGIKDVNLPTFHGFDEFLGVIHENVVDSPIDASDKPQNSTAVKNDVPRGVIRSFANGRILNTGPLTPERKKSIDKESIAAAIEFMERAHAEGKPFYVWWNGTRTHFKDEIRNASVQDDYGDAMVEHDGYVGQLLAKLDELGIADDTIVHYSTDSGPRMNSGPDSATSPFFGANTRHRESGWRVPSMVRWPARIEAGSVSNEIMHHMDWLPTLLAAAGAPDIKAQLKKGGVLAIGRRYTAHLDGYNFLPHLVGDEQSGPRREIFYFAGTGELTAIRHDDWKGIIQEQPQDETVSASIDAWKPLLVPLITNLRRDPYERVLETTETQFDWLIDRTVFYEPALEHMSEFLVTFEEFPPRQQPGTAGIDLMLEMLQASDGSN